MERMGFEQGGVFEPPKVEGLEAMPQSETREQRESQPRWEFLAEAIRLKPDMREYLERFPVARDFLAKRFYDPGLNRQLEPVELLALEVLDEDRDVRGLEDLAQPAESTESREVDELIDPEIIRQFFRSEAALPPVFSRVAWPMLQQANWEILVAFDLSGVFGANSLPTSREKAGGDYLIRNAVSALSGTVQGLQQQTGKNVAVLRLAGDEFAIIMQDSDGLAGSVKAEQWQGLLDQEMGQEPGLYLVDKKVRSRPIRASVKDTVPGGLDENQEQHLLDKIEVEELLAKKLESVGVMDQVMLGVISQRDKQEQMALLRALDTFQGLRNKHPEFADVWHDLWQVGAFPDEAPVIQMFTTVLEDPLLKGRVERFVQMKKIKEEIDVSTYHDMDDWLHHQEWSYGKSGGFSAVRVTLTGALKAINDGSDAGYERGDELIKNHFDRLMDVLLLTILPALQLPLEVKVLRRGPDLYVGLPLVEELERHGLENGLSGIGPVRILLELIEERLTPAKPEEFVDKKGVVRQVPIIPVATLIEVRPPVMMTPADRAEPSADMAKEWKQTLDRFDKVAIPRRTYERLAQLLEQPTTSKEVGQFLREFYFNQEEKRGKGRVDSLKLKPDERQWLDLFLAGQSDELEMAKVLGEVAKILRLKAAKLERTDLETTESAEAAA